MKIIFFDGDCGICNRFIQFLIEHDTHHQFHYAPLQGETARKILPEIPDLSTMIFSSEGKLHFQSEGALKILIALGGKWQLFGILLAIPRFIRDRIYSVFARNRHRVTASQCRLLTTDEKKYFLP